MKYKVPVSRRDSNPSRFGGSVGRADSLLVKGGRWYSIPLSESANPPYRKGPKK